jgi:chromosome segregation ATPase
LLHGSPLINKIILLKAIPRDNQMKKLIFILPALCLSLACASMPTMPTMPMGGNQEITKDQVHAENRVMKKNLELALRENEVLKTENAQYKSQVKAQSSEISALNDDIASLNTRYDEETTRLGEEITRLNESYEIVVNDFTLFEQESSQKINALTGQNAGLEKQLADETARLNGINKDQKASFDAQIKAASKELASAKADFAARELALQNQLTKSKQTVMEKDTAIASLEAREKTALEKIKMEEKTIQEQSEKIRQMEKAHQELTASRQDLQKIIEEKQVIIDSLSRKPGPNPVASQPAPQSVPQPVKQKN